jgi:uncharacterized membrane protein YhiD involved in acid resistance
MNESLGFVDVFKKSLLDDGFSSTMSVSDILIILLSTLIMSSFIFYMYKKTFRGVLYTESFNISLVLVSIVTSIVIMTISSNIILSLGMVGALSIVRFRTAIKDSMDIVFMFWAIAIGIANGAGYFKISIVGSIVVGFALILFSKYKSSNSPYLLILDFDSSDSAIIKGKLYEFFGDVNIKSETTSKNSTELAIEIRLNEEKKIRFTKILQSIPKIKKSSLISYNGDYVS